MNGASTAPNFEVSLTLAGAISAGAYTAGVLDFLVEALDAWHAQPDCPHNVILKGASGASAGAICAAILGGTLDYDFPHVRRLPPGLGPSQYSSGNALFDAWVNKVDIKELLKDDDLRIDRHAMSVLDATKLDGIARSALTIGGKRKSRRYVANPFRIRVTLTNLRGIPYALSMRGGTGAGHTMMMHEDHKRFAIRDSTPGSDRFQADAPASSGDWRYEVPLDFPADDDRYTPWSELVDAALASAAFPFGLRPRTVSKPRSDYSGLPLAYQDDENKTMVYATMPDWAAGTADPYGFATVDGGAMYNVPIELARQILVGDDPLRRNDRSGKCTTGAVLLIDPFVGRIPEGPAVDTDAALLKAPVQLFGAYKNNARYHPLDLLLAADDKVFSRFLIAPSRGGANDVADGKSIACGSLGGFGGFLAWDFRAHDYFLGRRNCQRFLQLYFSLPEANPLFEKWGRELKDKYQLADGELPILPLVDEEIQKEETLPPWPRGKCDVDALMPLVEQRIDRLYGRLSGDVKGVRHLALWIGWNWFGKPRLRELAQDQIANGLKSHSLA